MKYWLVLAALLGGCSTGAAQTRAPVSECMITTAVDCDEQNADVVVTGEVVIRPDGAGRLLRITDISPREHPLRAKAVAAAQQPAQYSPSETIRTVTESFPYCGRPSVDVIASGECPSREKIDQQVQAQGYRLRSFERIGPSKSGQ